MRRRRHVGRVPFLLGSHHNQYRRHLTRSEVFHTNSIPPRRGTGMSSNPKRSTDPPKAGAVSSSRTTGSSAPPGSSGGPTGASSKTKKSDHSNISKGSTHSTRPKAGQSKSVFDMHSARQQKSTKRSTSRIVPAPNLPAFAYKDNPVKPHSRLASVGTSRQGSIEDLAVDKTHSRISQHPEVPTPAVGSKKPIVYVVAAGAVAILIILFVAGFILFRGSGDKTSTHVRSTKAG